MPTPQVTVRLRDDEKTEMQARAKERGLDLATALRNGGRILLGMPGIPTYKRGRPRKDA